MTDVGNAMVKRRKEKTVMVQMGFRCARWLSDKIHDAAAARAGSVNSEIARRLEASLLADEITRAVNEERERCALLAEGHYGDGHRLAAKIRGGDEDHHTG